MIEHSDTIIKSVGGLGLFLLGMIVMTQGLRALAGDAMRRALMRFTRSPLSGALSGAGTTAVLQSSSVTTIATIGFVSAGLISFPEAVGIIFGANLGTTVTGWLVALIGFKLKIGLFSLPFIFIGAVMKILGRQKISAVGLAVAGFGLIFFGIAVMQEGMGSIRAILTPELMPSDSLGGRLLLVFLGVVTTVITMSSSAGVAATMTLLYGGAIGFEQAAALVIGMDMGTTVKAIIATIGASRAAKRTGYTHVLYNFFTGLVGFLLITPFVLGYETLFPDAIAQNPEIALVAFHSTFNIIGLCVMLPFTVQFANMMKRLFPSGDVTYTDRLDQRLLKEPLVALKAVKGAIEDEMVTLLHHLVAILENNPKYRVDLAELQRILDETHAYLDEIELHGKQKNLYEALIAYLQALDHMQRLHERCEEEEKRAVSARQSKILDDAHALLSETVWKLIADFQRKRWHKAARRAHKAAEQINADVEPLRQKIMEHIATDQMDVPKGTEMLEGIRWLGRVSNHLHHITLQMDRALISMGK